MVRGGEGFRTNRMQGSVSSRHLSSPLPICLCTHTPRKTGAQAQGGTVSQGSRGRSVAWTQALGAGRQPVSRGAEGLRLGELMRSRAETHPAENDKRTALQSVPTITISWL